MTDRAGYADRAAAGEGVPEAMATVTAEDFADGGGDAQLVEVTVFPGERIDDVAAHVRDAGDTILTTLPRSLIATVSSRTIAELAGRSGR